MIKIKQNFLNLKKLFTLENVLLNMKYFAKVLQFFYVCPHEDYECCFSCKHVHMGHVYREEVVRHADWYLEYCKRNEHSHTLTVIHFL
jgi:hypothetical protein